MELSAKVRNMYTAKVYTSEYIQPCKHAQARVIVGHLCVHPFSYTLVAITTIMGTLYRKVFSCIGDGVFASWKPSDIPESELLDIHIIIPTFHCQYLDYYT